jgi:hypothetical protein
MPPVSPLEPLDLSVVAPAHNEQENAENLVNQVHAALAPTGIAFEFIIVDDGSTDRTRAIVQSMMATRPWLRCVAMTDTPPGKGNGQSAAFKAGFAACRGRLVAVLDADLQNDPADLPMMIRTMAEQNADMVQGDRSYARQDTFIRRWGSIVGRLFRRMILGDTVRDTTHKTVTAALKLSSDVDILVIGQGSKAAADAAAKIAGVRKVLLAESAGLGHQLAEAVTATVTGLADGYDAILSPATTDGKNFMPRIAAKLDVAPISDIIEVVSNDTFVRPIYAGNALETVQSSDGKKVITVRGSVSFTERSMICLISIWRYLRRFSRMRSSITTLSFSE